MTRKERVGGKDSKDDQLSRPHDTAPVSNDKSDNGTGLIVGIGASAGGLGAFSSFLANMPDDSGLAFILIQHLSPDHKSILTDLLAQATPHVRA
jgi:two-component system, chemotaxis family, CheB/CheR fusion protein